MILRFKRKDGAQVEFEIGDRPITIGRSPEADLVILDDKVSRLHCGIRLWDGDFVLKDLKSRNGTYVNGQRVETAKLHVGDRIRIGSCVFTVENEPGKGTETILRELAEEMAEGKGYSTMLKEIVEDASAPPAAPPPAEDAVEVVDEAPPAAKQAPETVIAPARRVVKVRVSPPHKGRSN
ncbi:MAG: FHA domain-containing protein [Kiritimatiellae bacterium]|nr:FHA domain-containing protein [Kiritimatiellia bacterium]